MDENNPDYAKITAYIDHNPAAVLSTINEDGTPHGAVVYVCTASHHTVCLVTKNATQKFANIAKHPNVSLTFFNERESSTLQATGNAFVADDPHLIDYVLDKIKKAHAMQAGWVPPVTKITDGDFAVIGIELTHVRLAAFQSAGIDSQGSFTEL